MRSKSRNRKPELDSNAMDAMNGWDASDGVEIFSPRNSHMAGRWVIHFRYSTPGTRPPEGKSISGGGGGDSPSARVVHFQSVGRIGGTGNMAEYK